jgi:hypothetical protein
MDGLVGVYQFNYKTIASKVDIKKMYGLGCWQIDIT